jgi:putative zinc finger/helix-turn-helix YgiT family protein
MTILCINCAKANLERTSVRLSGEIRKHPYTVEMEGLKCPNCGYSTVDSKSAVELGRLAADEYRRANGLLTSNEIVALRHSYGDNQEQFAKRLGVGVASIKRWELGKIQEKRYDDLIREKTKTPVENTIQYVRSGPSTDATCFSSWSVSLRAGTYTANTANTVNTVNLIEANIWPDPVSLNTGGACIVNLTKQHVGLADWNTAEQYIFPSTAAPATTTPLDLIPIIARGSHARH